MSGWVDGTMDGKTGTKGPADGRCCGTVDKRTDGQTDRKGLFRDRSKIFGEVFE
jgi:hypothetical protein